MQSVTGTALFLVESKYFDEAKEKKAKAAEKRAEIRKRKAAKNVLDAQPTKCARRANGTQNKVQERVTQPEVEEEDDEDEDGDKDNKDKDEDEEDEAERRAYEAGRRAVYEKIPVLERKRGIRPVESIEPAMDDMINAKTRKEVGCFRKPLKLYFRQDEQGKRQ